MNIWFRRTVPAITAFLVWASPVAAFDFEITVPLEIRNVADSALVIVLCEALGPEPGQVVGNGVAIMPANDFLGPVLVAFDANPNQNANDGTGYYCYLFLRAGPMPPTATELDQMTDQVLTWEECLEIPLVPREHPLRCGAEGAIVVGWVFGDFENPEATGK